MWPNAVMGFSVQQHSLLMLSNGGLSQMGSHQSTSTVIADNDDVFPIRSTRQPF